MKHINLSSLKEAFAPAGSGHSESHTLLSLSKRLLISRATLRTMLQRGELKPQKVTEIPQGNLYLFSGPYLDSARESVVEEIVREVSARLKGLNVGESEIALAALHSLRDQSQRIELAAKRPEEEEEEDESDSPGGTAGNIAGAGIGGAIGSKGGARGAILGGVIGAASGHLIGKGVDRLTANSKDKERIGNAIAGGAVAAGGAYIGHRAIKARGGYGEAGKALVGQTRVAARKAGEILKKAAPIADAVTRRVADGAYAGGRKIQKAAGIAQDALRSAGARGAGVAAAIGKLGSGTAKAGRILAALRRALLRGRG